MMNREIRYNPTRVDYAVNEHQLESLEKIGHNQNKDTFLTLLGITLSCLINAINQMPDSFENTTLAFYFNSVIGIVGLFLCFIYGINWYKSKDDGKELIEAIKKQPKYNIEESDTKSEGNKSNTLILVQSQTGNTISDLTISH